MKNDINTAYALYVEYTKTKDTSNIKEIKRILSALIRTPGNDYQGDEYTISLCMKVFNRNFIIFNQTILRFEQNTTDVDSPNRVWFLIYESHSYNTGHYKVGGFERDSVFADNFKDLPIALKDIYYFYNTNMVIDSIMKYTKSIIGGEIEWESPFYEEISDNNTIMLEYVYGGDEKIRRSLKIYNSKHNQYKYCIVFGERQNYTPILMNEDILKIGLKEFIKTKGSFLPEWTKFLEREIKNYNRADMEKKIYIKISSNIDNNQSYNSDIVEIYSKTNAGVKFKFDCIVYQNENKFIRAMVTGINDKNLSDYHEFNY